MSDVNNALVVLLGMGTVFVGLICIVFLCMAMSAVVKKFDKAMASNTTSETPAPAPVAPIADRQAVIAGVCAVIAEELGTDVKNIKVVSFNRV